MLGFQTTGITNVTMIPESRLITANGSAFSHAMCEPHVAGRHFSGNDSGTASSRKQTSRIATNDASAITRLSLYARPRYAPIAGLVTRLAANEADT